MAIKLFIFWLQNSQLFHIHNGCDWKVAAKYSEIDSHVQFSKLQIG
jgi:hypothetical protein